MRRYTGSTQVHQGIWKLALVVGMTGLALISLTGCRFIFGGDTTYQKFVDIKIPTGFTFSMAKTVIFDLTVKKNNEDGTGTIPYANSLVEVVYQSDSGDRVIGSAVTDNAGAVTFDVLVPGAVSAVTIRTQFLTLVERIVALSPSTTTVKLDLAPPSVDDVPAGSAIATRYMASTAKDAAPPTTIPFVTTSNGYRTLSTFDSNGVPSGLNLNATTGKRPANPFRQSFVDNVGATFPEYKKVPDTNPGYLTVGDKSNLILTEDAEVSVTFISEGAGYKNTLAYFVYKTGQAPAIAPPKSELVVIFPNASALYSSGGLLSGDSIDLRNPVQFLSTGQVNPYYQTKVFNAGYTICWVTMASGFSGSNIGEGYGRYYSLYTLNPESGTQIDKSHTALLVYNIDPYTGLVAGDLTKFDPVLLLGFEDLNRKTGDNDFNDILFSVKTTPYRAADTTGMPQAKKQDPTDQDGDTVLDIYDEYPDDIERASSVSYPSTTGYGSALFEDLWPSVGDFDFNDLVTDYRFKTVRNAAGNAVELIASFRLRAAGGGKVSGLAFTLPVSADKISSVTRQTTAAKWSIGAPFSPDAKTVEANGASSVSIPVFQSAHAMFNLEGAEMTNTLMDQPYKGYVDITVTVKFAPGIQASVVSGSPVDIFLVGYEGTLRKEVHPIGFRPTVLAQNSGLFGTADDDSPTGVGANGLYYKSKKTSKSSAGAPWAILTETSVKYPTERTELPSAFLHFGQWVVSTGSSYTDWTNNQKSGYVDLTRIYSKEP